MNYHPIGGKRRHKEREGEGRRGKGWVEWKEWGRREEREGR